MIYLSLQLSGSENGRISNDQKFFSLKVHKIKFKQIGLSDINRSEGKQSVTNDSKMNDFQ